MILCNHFHAAFRKHKFKSFSVLHFYDLNDVQEPEMRRQMTDPPSLFSGKENPVSMRMGKNCTAPKKAFHMLRPAPMAEPVMHGLPNTEHFREGSGSTAQQPWAFPHTLGSTVCWQGRKEPQQFTKCEQGMASLASAWLTRQPCCTHLTDPVSQVYHAKLKCPSVNWRTCSISDLIVLNIASSLQINGNIKSCSNGIPQSLWSS